MTEHLIANSGLQFIVQDVEFNPTSQFLLSNGRPLRYTFLDKVEVDPVFGNQDTFFDFVCSDSSGNFYIQLDELKNVNGSLDAYPPRRPGIHREASPLRCLTICRIAQDCLCQALLSHHIVLLCLAYALLRLSRPSHRYRSRA